MRPRLIASGATFPRSAALVLAVALLAWLVPPSAIGQISLEDVVARSFDVTVTLTPVALQIDRSTGRFLNQGSMRGRTRIVLEITAPQPIQQVRMELRADVTVRSVQAEGTQVSFTRSGRQLTLTFPQGLAPSARVPVTFEYDGQPCCIYNEFVELEDGEFYPVLVSPFGDYSLNLARITVQVTAPEGFVVVTTGRQVSATGNTIMWDSEVPVAGVALAGGQRHRKVERTVGNIRLQVYVRPGEERNLDKLTTFTGQAVEFYSRLLYPYPNTELKVVSLLIVGGGIGYPALLLIDDRAFTGNFGGGYDRDSYLFGFMAHETAHSYVPGQTVTKGVGYIWQSEGFAEYLSLMAIEAVMGPQAYARELQEERDGYAAIAGESGDRPIGSFTRANYGSRASQRIIYDKGSLVLHMLRYVIGDEAFRKTLTTYFQRTRGRAARLDEFREIAEEASGQKLDWFFDEWILQVVLPDYVVASATTARTDDGQYRTTATIRNSGTGVMPVDVAFGTGEARVIRRVEVPSRGETMVTVTTPQAIRQVEVDPNKWIIQKNYKNDTFEIR